MEMCRHECTGGEFKMRFEVRVAIGSTSVSLGITVSRILFFVTFLRIESVAETLSSL